MRPPFIYEECDIPLRISVKTQAHFIPSIPDDELLRSRVAVPQVWGWERPWEDPESHEGVFQDQNVFKRYSKTLLAFWPSFSHGSTVKFPEAPMMCAAITD